MNCKIRRIFKTQSSGFSVGMQHIATKVLVQCFSHQDLHGHSAGIQSFEIHLNSRPSQQERDERKMSHYSFKRMGALDEMWPLPPAAGEVQSQTQFGECRTLKIPLQLQVADQKTPKWLLWRALNTSLFQRRNSYKVIGKANHLVTQKDQVAFAKPATVLTGLSQPLHLTEYTRYTLSQVPFTQHRNNSTPVLNRAPTVRYIQGGDAQ